MVRANKKYRFERKYLLDYDSAFLLKQRVSYAMQPDDSSPGGKYRVSSLYFDDQYNSSFYKKQNGLLRRDKFRARFYNGSMDVIRLERKLKHGEMICKEGALISPQQYQMMRRGEYGFMADGFAADDSSPIFEEFYAAHAVKRMRPVAMIDFARQAYMNQAGNVRITFDSDLSANLPAAGHSFSILPDERIILEVKYDGFLPSHIQGLLTGVPLTQLAISKYVMAKLTLHGR